uniref:hypothetical protein n=1 Tax=uncultured Altererythrobacter sp. TaxID=500840 RepID=UPI002639F821|nr:hypothetical protein [uncultured Altererythrobacter sp.]
MFSTLLALAMIAQAEPAQTASEAEEPKTDQAQEQKAEDERICRRISTGMGSRKKERVCMTSQEWREFNRGN